MKVLLFGATGFIGRAIRKNLSDGHEVIAAVRSDTPADDEVFVDLLDQKSIQAALDQFKPDIIVNSAGIVDPNADTMMNVEFTKNIFEATIMSNAPVRKVVISGSAGEYGRILSEEELPVSEDTPLRADNGYGLAKKLEEAAALKYHEEGFPGVVIARIFNPIGVGMADKFLVTRIKKQINECIEGNRASIEISRKDSRRDYIVVDDIASAIRVLVEGDPKHTVYNIGSGVAMSNGDLLQLMVSSSKIEHEPEVIETSEQPEPLVASQADIARIQSEFHWAPKYTIADIVEEIMND